MLTDKTTIEGKDIYWFKKYLRRNGICTNGWRQLLKAIEYEDWNRAWMLIYSDVDFKPNNHYIQDRNNIIRTLRPYLGNIAYSYFSNGSIAWEVHYNDNNKLVKKIFYHKNGTIKLIQNF